MAQITADTIAPLIADQRESGRTMTFTFRCPASGHTVTAQHTVAGGGGQMGSHMKRTAKRTAMYEVRRAVGPMLRGVFGRSAVGRMAGHMADAALRQATNQATRSSSPSRLSSKEKQQAAVEAFKTVVSQFAWDEPNGRWISLQAAKELMSPFQQQLAEGPVEHPYDKSVLARMLVEVASADGSLAEAERSFLMDFLDPELGSVDSLAMRPPLTTAELSQSSQGAVRGSMLMLAWVLSLSDEAFDPAEQQKLSHFAQGLGIDRAQHDKLLAAAQGFLLEAALDRMITWGGHDQHARGELMAMAQRIGMSPAQAEQVEAAFQRRRGNY